MIPSETSTGDTVRHGRITKMGNHYLRRVLVEAAWHYRHYPHIGPTLRRRRADQPARVIAIADQAPTPALSAVHRAHVPSETSAQGGRGHARELAGFLWAALHKGPEPAPVRGNR